MSLWVAAQTFGISAVPPSLVSAADLLKVESDPSSKLLRKMLKRTGLSIDL